jgi:hypothetical protein
MVVAQIDVDFVGKPGDTHMHIASYRRTDSASLEIIDCVIDGTLAPLWFNERIDAALTV